MFSMNMRNMVILQTLIVLTIWALVPMGSFPSLQSTFSGLSTMWLKEGLAEEILSSLKLYCYSIALTIAVSMIISYAAVLPKVGAVDIGLIFKPLAEFVSKCRVLSPVGFQLIFQILTPDMWWLKVSIMVFSVAPWFVCAINSILDKMHICDLNYARTLRFSEWRTFYEVRLLGNIHNIMDAFGQIAAMGWMMITVVEKISKVDGGLGTMLAGQERFHEMSKIFAIQLFVILTIGIAWDKLIKYVRALLCPYAIMQEEKK